MTDNAFTDFFTDTLFLGIPLASWLFALAATVVSFVVMRLAIRFVMGRLRAAQARSEGRLSRIALDVLSGTSNLLLALAALLIGVGLLDLPPQWLNRVSSLWFVVFILQVALWGNRAITLGMTHYFHHRVNGQPGQVSALWSLTIWATKVLLWTVVLLAMLSNLGVNITAFIASLGVGGIAVALAVQNVLGDLFASLSIAVDKPFEVGDFIVIDPVAGTVEHVGLKTTRIRSLGGEQIVMSNANLLDSTIHNYKRLTERRVVFEFSVARGCTAEQAREVSRIVERLIRALDKSRFDRAHLKGFGESSLDYEVVYYVLDPGYNLYMDMQQEINVGLMQAFEDLGVSFALPIRVVHVASMPPGADEGTDAPRQPAPRASQAARKDGGLLVAQ